MQFHFQKDRYVKQTLQKHTSKAGEPEWASAENAEEDPPIQEGITIGILETRTEYLAVPPERYI